MSGGIPTGALGRVQGQGMQMGRWAGGVGPVGGSKSGGGGGGGKHPAARLGQRQKPLALASSRRLQGIGHSGCRRLQRSEAKRRGRQGSGATCGGGRRQRRAAATRRRPQTHLEVGHRNVRACGRVAAQPAGRLGAGAREPHCRRCQGVLGAALRAG